MKESSGTSWGSSTHRPGPSQLAEPRAVEVSEFLSQVVPALPDRVPLAGDAVERLEGAHPALLVDREVLARGEGDDPSRDRVAVEGSGGVEQTLHVGGDARRYQIDALPHVHHRPARGVLDDGPDVIEVSVADDHERAG